MSKKHAHDYYFLPVSIRTALRLSTPNHSNSPDDPNWIGYIWYKSVIHDMAIMQIGLTEGRKAEYIDRYGSVFVGVYVEEILPRSGGEPADYFSAKKDTVA